MYIYRKIIVPLDGSRGSEGVFTQLGDHLAPEGNVILLQVIRPSKRMLAAGGHVILGSSQDESRRAAALEYLRSVVWREVGGSERWRCEVIVADDVARAVASFAEREGADFITMYTHDRRGLARLIKGSVSRDVERAATMDVRVLGPKELAAVG